MSELLNMSHDCVSVPLVYMDIKIELFTALIPNETYVVFQYY